MFSGWLKILVASALIAVAAAGTYWCRQLPTRRAALEVLPVSGDQVRITWNGASAAALLAPSGAIEIRDGADFHSVLLSGEQVRQGSLVYRRATREVRVSLRMDPGERWARLKPELDFASFQTASAPAEEPLRRATVAAGLHAPLPAAAKEPQRDADQEPVMNSEDRAVVPRRAAVIPDSSLIAHAPEEPLLIPLAPALAIPRPAVSAPALAIIPPGAVPTPRQPAYAGPGFGRIIWTGTMGRRGVIEIEGERASIGSLIGRLPGVPVTVRVSPAEFSSRGLVVYTTDVSSDGRVETASAANGWNATLFRWEPDRARELVMLEAPNPSNGFKRLAVRSDARTCNVVLVEWSVR